MAREAAAANPGERDVDRCYQAYLRCRKQNPGPIGKQKCLVKLMACVAGAALRNAETLDRPAPAAGGGGGTARKANARRKTPPAP